MSYVTDVVVHVDYAPEEAERLLAAPFPFEERYPGVGLKLMDFDLAGGVRNFQGDVYAGAFNYLDVDALADWFVNLPWGDGDAFLHASSEGEVFRLIVIHHGAEVALKTCSCQT